MIENSNTLFTSSATSAQKQLAKARQHRHHTSPMWSYQILKRFMYPQHRLNKLIILWSIPVPKNYFHNSNIEKIEVEQQWDLDFPFIFMLKFATIIFHHIIKLTSSNSHTIFLKLNKLFHEFSCSMNNCSHISQFEYAWLTWARRFSSVGSLRSSLVLPLSVRRLTCICNQASITYMKQAANTE